MFFKIGVLKTFVKLAGRHRLFFNKAEGLRPATLLKRRF